MSVDVMVGDASSLVVYGKGDGLIEDDLLVVLSLVVGDIVDFIIDVVDTGTVVGPEMDVKCNKNWTGLEIFKFIIKSLREKELLCDKNRS